MLARHNKNDRHKKSALIALGDLRYGGVVFPALARFLLRVRGKL